MLAQVRGKTGPSGIIAGCSKAVLSYQIIFGNIDSWPQMLKQSCEAVMLASVDLHFVEVGMSLPSTSWLWLSTMPARVNDAQAKIWGTRAGTCQ